MTNELLIGIIILLIGGHYASVVWEIRSLRLCLMALKADIAELDVKIVRASEQDIRSAALNEQAIAAITKAVEAAAAAAAAASQKK